MLCCFAICLYVYIVYTYTFTNFCIYSVQCILCLLIDHHLKVYWSVTYLLFLLEYGILVLVFWLFGSMANINFFTLHSPIILFLYLFLWGNCLIAFSFLLTSCFAKTRTAVAVGFILIFAFVFGGYMVFETLSSDPNTPRYVVNSSY